MKNVHPFSHANYNIGFLIINFSLFLNYEKINFAQNKFRRAIRNGDEITSTSRRTDLGQICSI